MYVLKPRSLFTDRCSRMKVILILRIFTTFSYGTMAIGRIKYEREGDQEKNTKAAHGKTKGNIIQNP